MTLSPWTLAAIALAGCLRPAPMGVARVQLCVTAETSPGPDWNRPRPTRGASACVDFEPAADPPPEPEGE